MDIPQGEFVHGEFSGNASTAQAITLYDANGAAYTLSGTQRVWVESYHIVATAAAVIQIFSDNDADAAVDAGEIVAQGTFAALGGLAENSIQHPTKPGKTLKVKSSTTDTVYVIVRGMVVNS